MLNGKKSYLLSFTALFSKKGYELSVGLDYLVDINNQYHLTAPVYSTYRTLREDSMKIASKTNHKATGVFGKTHTALNSTEPEGAGMETVVANVIAYLHGIHKYLSGEHNTSRAPEIQEVKSRRAERYDYANAGSPVAMITGQDLPKDMHEEYYTASVDVIVNMEQSKMEAFKYISDVLDAEIGDKMIETSQKVNVSEIVELVITDLDFKRMYVDVNDLSFRPKEWKYADIEPFMPADIINEIHDISTITTRKTNDVYDATIENKYRSTLTPDVIDSIEYDRHSETSLRINSVYIQEFVTNAEDIYYLAGHQTSKLVTISPLYLEKDAHNEDFVDTYKKLETPDKEESLILVRNTTTDFDLTIEQMYKATVEKDYGLYISTGSDSITSDYEASVYDSTEGVFGIGSNDVDVESKVTAHPLRDKIVNAPEVTRAVRLMEIMYGAPVLQYVSAGIDDILREALTNEFKEVDFALITDEVLSKLSSMTIYSNSEGVYAEGEHAVRDKTLEGLTITTTGSIKTEGKTDTITDEVTIVGTKAMDGGGVSTIEEANINVAGKQGIIHDIGKAIHQANAKLAIVHDNTESEEYLGKLSVEYQGTTVETPTIEELSDVAYIESAHREDKTVEGAIDRAAQSKHITEIIDGTVEKEVVAGIGKNFEGYVQYTEDAQHRSLADGQLHEEDTAMHSISQQEALVHGAEHGERMLIDILGAPADSTVESRISEFTSESIVSSQEAGDIRASSEETLVAHTEKAISDKVLEAVTHEDENAYIDYVGKEITMPRIEGGESYNSSDVDVSRQEKASMELITITGEISTIEGAVHDITADSIEDKLDESSRKKRSVPIDIEDTSDGNFKGHSLEVEIEDTLEGNKQSVATNIEVTDAKEAVRNKGRLETNITDVEQSKRSNNTVETTTDDVDTGKRHKVIEIDVEGAEEGLLITPPEKKKSRIWLIIGKIASWSIWNWKKTR